MTVPYLPIGVDHYATSNYTKIKMERYSREEQERARTATMSPTIPIATVMTANENWRGKNDPAERRRIQNRLNQRAFRERQRAGESPKQYKPRSMSSASQQDSSEDEADSPQSGASLPSPTLEGRAVSETLGEQSTRITDPQTGRVWDELGQLINRNFLAAAVTNAQHLGIDLSALRAGTPMRTPRNVDLQVPASLTPVELQYQVAHDPIIDTIPHARLRFNILRGIATGQVDASTFSKCLRASGALEPCNGNWQRGGVVVWSTPEQMASWELSEPFIRRWWAFLLEGCEDLLAATNAWRSRRGEKLFPQSLPRSGP